jgi:pilus assembly protein CpaE
LSELPRKMRLLAAAGDASGDIGGVKVQRVGVVDGAVGGGERFASLAALFPQITFEPVGALWPQKLASPVDILIVAVDAASSADVEAAAQRLKIKQVAAQVVVVLHDADVVTTRRLIREGAADVLPAPVTEPALAISLERLLAIQSPVPEPGQGAGDVVAILKAGGGVGATALATQVCAILAGRGSGEVCLADLDLQFGAAALYLDLPEAITVADCLSAGSSLDETPFATALAAHRSGARVLAAPRDLTPLEAMAPHHVEALLKGLRRDFALTILDLPSVWTAWTNRTLHLADRIVMVTQLSVPHIHMVKRQLRVFAAQRLEERPLTLVCNALTAEQQGGVSLKAAERALGRTFDVVIPEDRRVMNAAINQGQQISAIRRGTKLEKAIVGLADRMAGATVPAKAARGRW